LFDLFAKVYEDVNVSFEKMMITTMKKHSTDFRLLSKWSSSVYLKLNLYQANEREQVRMNEHLIQWMQIVLSVQMYTIYTHWNKLFIHVCLRSF